MKLTEIRALIEAHAEYAPGGSSKHASIEAFLLVTTKLLAVAEAAEEMQQWGDDLSPGLCEALAALEADK